MNSVIPSISSFLTNWVVETKALSCSQKLNGMHVINTFLESYKFLPIQNRNFYFAEINALFSKKKKIAQQERIQWNALKMPYKTIATEHQCHTIFDFWILCFNSLGFNHKSMQDPPL